MQVLSFFPVLALSVMLVSCPGSSSPDPEPVSDNVLEGDSAVIATSPEPDTTNHVSPSEDSPEREPEKKVTTVTKKPTPSENTPGEPQEKPRDRPRPVHPYVIIADPVPLAGKSTSMNINSATVERGYLTVNFSYGGGCKTHVFEMFSSGKQSEPGVIQVYLVDHTTDDNCKSLITEKAMFDIKSLKDPSRHELLIRINDHKPPVSWQY